eukprot:gene4377-biopygen7444
MGDLGGLHSGKGDAAGLLEIRGGLRSGQECLEGFGEIRGGPQQGILGKTGAWGTPEKIGGSAVSARAASLPSFLAVDAVVLLFAVRQQRRLELLQVGGGPLMARHRVRVRAREVAVQRLPHVVEEGGAVRRQVGSLSRMWRPQGCQGTRNSLQFPHPGRLRSTVRAVTWQTVPHFEKRF